MDTFIASRMEITSTLLDTNVLIYALAGKEPYSLFYRRIIESNNLMLSSIVVAEFLSNATSSEEHAVKLLMDEFPVLPVDKEVALEAALYRKKYLKKKRKIALPDCLIAATCKVHNCILATFNISDYPMKDIHITDCSIL